MADGFTGLIVGAVLGWIGKAIEHRTQAKRDRDEQLRATYAEFAATYGALLSHLNLWIGAERAEQDMRAERKTIAAELRAQTMAIETEKLAAIDRFEHETPNQDLNNVIRREFDEALRATRETDRAHAALTLMDDDDGRRELIRKLVEPPLPLPGSPEVDLAALQADVLAREKRLQETIASIGASLRTGPNL
jgi:hypothetical protein